MAPLQKLIAEQVSMILCIIICNIHANPLEELDKCINQISNAFGNNNSSTECLRHAIQYYIKNEHIPIQNEYFTNNNRIVPDEVQNIADEIKYVGNELQNVSNNSRKASEVFEPEYALNDEQNNVVHESAYYQIQTKKNKKPRIQVYNFHDLMSSRLEDELQNEPTEDLSVTTEDEFVSSILVENQYVTTEDEDVTNYAMLYHKALEEMIHGTGVPKRDDFCDTYFTYDYPHCYKVLESFGNTGRSAVQRAYNNYKLSDCEAYMLDDFDYIYIYKYMKIIIGQCIAKVDKCFRQIKIAFGYKSSSRECFKHAIKYYTKRQHISVDDKILLAEDQNVDDETQNVASSSQSAPDEIQNVGDQAQNVNHEIQNVASRSQNTSEYVIQVNTFEDLMSGRPADETQNVASSSQSAPIERQNVSNEPQSNSSQQQFFKKPRLQVNTFEDLMSSRSAVEPQNVSTEEEDDSNYAMLYHIELEKMIQGGRGVQKPEDFCAEFFVYEYGPCKNALEPFGDTSHTAVEKAFSSYKLADCLVYRLTNFKYNFICKYMEYIIARTTARSARKPLKFCEDLIKQKFPKST